MLTFFDGRRLMMFPRLHSSHKQQRPPSDLCSPQHLFLQRWKEQGNRVLIHVQVTFEYLLAVSVALAGNGEIKSPCFSQKTFEGCWTYKMSCIKIAKCNLCALCVNRVKVSANSATHQSASLNQIVEGQQMNQTWCFFLLK